MDPPTRRASYTERVHGLAGVVDLVDAWQLLEPEAHGLRERGVDEPHVQGVGERVLDEGGGA
jgi:hypothetical protein